MTVAFKQLGAKTSGATTSPVSVAWPTPLSAGDLVVLRCCSGQGGDSFTISDAGFVSKADGASGGTTQLFAKVADGTETGSFTVTASTSVRCYYSTAVFTGCTATVAATAVNNSGTGANIPSGSYNPTVDNTLVIRVGSKQVNGTSITAASGFTLLDADNSATPSCCAWDYQIQTTATSIGVVSFGIGSGDNAGNVHQSSIVALVPASFVPYPPLYNGGMIVQVCQ